MSKLTAYWKYKANMNQKKKPSTDGKTTKAQNAFNALAAVTQAPPEDGNGSQNEESGEPKRGKNLA